ncbi:MAG: hypothetical protein ACSHXD_02045 [Marinosulfonomonas sp.]
MATRSVLKLAAVMLTSVAILPAFTTSVAQSADDSLDNLTQESLTPVEIARMMEPKVKVRGLPGNVRVKAQPDQSTRRSVDPSRLESFNKNNGDLGPDSNSNVAQIAFLKAVVAETSASKAALADALNALAEHEQADPGFEAKDMALQISQLDINSPTYGQDLANLQAKYQTAAWYDAEKGLLQDAVVSAQDTYEQMTQAFDEALLAATGGRVLSDDALDYFRTKLGF